MTFIAAIFNITPAAVPAKGELPHESEPAQVEQRVHDRVDGVDGSLDFLTNGEVYMLRHYVYGDAVFRVGNSTNVTLDGVNCSAVTVEGNEWVRSRYSPLSPFLAFKNAEAYYLFIK